MAHATRRAMVSSMTVYKSWEPGYSSEPTGPFIGAFSRLVRRRSDVASIRKEESHDPRPVRPVEAHGLGPHGVPFRGRGRLPVPVPVPALQSISISHPEAR